MIIANLMGGLGNQMFQYALGRTISDKKGYELFLDTTGYLANSTDTVRQYKLDNFNIRADIASKEMLFLYKVDGIRKTVNTLTGIKLFTPKKPVISERGHGFSSDIMNITDNNYLFGFWQSEKYFLANRVQLINDFSLKNDLSSYSKQLMKKIKSVSSVAVHVRRGDYVTSKEANAFHGTCDSAYYLRSAKLLLKQKKNLEFFVFSDDIDWAKKNILNDEKNIYYVKNQVSDKADLEEMILMSNCQHNIIANSSFSWWGAWLNTNPDKIVIAPKQWFRNSDISTVDLIPDGWIRI